MQLVVEQHKGLDCVLELVVEDKLVPEEDMPQLAVEGLKWVVVEDPRLKFYYYTNLNVEQINYETTFWDLRVKKSMIFQFFRLENTQVLITVGVYILITQTDALL